MPSARAQPTYRPRSGVYRPLIAALLYFLGMVVLPSVHLGFHRNDHDHTAGGLHFHAAAEHPHSATAYDHQHASESAAADTELVSTWVQQSRDRLLLAVALKTQGARVTVSFIQAAPSPQLPSTPEHGSGSLAHFSCSYLSSQDVLPQLLVGLHLGPAPRFFTSQHAASAPFFGHLKARAPPPAQAS